MSTVHPNGLFKISAVVCRLCRRFTAFQTLHVRPSAKKNLVCDSG